MKTFSEFVSKNTLTESRVAGPEDYVSLHTVNEILSTAKQGLAIQFFTKVQAGILQYLQDTINARGEASDIKLTNYDIKGMLFKGGGVRLLVDKIDYSFKSSVDGQQHRGQIKNDEIRISVGGWR